MLSIKQKKSKVNGTFNLLKVNPKRQSPFRKRKNLQQGMWRLPEDLHWAKKKPERFEDHKLNIKKTCKQNQTSSSVNYAMGTKQISTPTKKQQIAVEIKHNSSINL